MREIVRKKLEQIDELYPKERLSKSKDRWGRLWHNLPPLDRHPFVAFPIGLNCYSPSHDMEQRLHEHLDEFIRRGRFHDDYIPAFSNGCRQGTIPSMFGVPEVILGEDYSCERLLHSATDIEHLPEAKITQDVMAYAWIEMARYYVEETEGRIPVHVCDMQGPIDVAGQLWGYENFFEAAYDTPEICHALLQKTTAAFILLWNSQKNAVGGELFVGTHLSPYDWIPQNFGATVSVDSMVMVSPSFFNEFFTPSLKIIAEHFGGITLHSCGDFSAVIPAVNNVPYIRGMHAGQMNIEQIMNSGIDKAITLITGYDENELMFDLLSNERQAVIPHVNPWPPGVDWNCWGEEEWNYIKKYENSVLSAALYIDNKNSSFTKHNICKEVNMPKP